MLAMFEKEIESIIEFIDQARYLAAHKLYIEINNKLDNDVTIKEDDISHVKNKLLMNSQIQLLLKRIIEIEKALEYQDTSDDWIVGSILLGITTYYKSNNDNMITIKMEGTMDNLPILEQFSVIREIDLFHEWVPFCNKSVMVDKIGHSEYFAYIDVGLPVVSRDFLINAYAADLVLEHNKVIILGESIEDYPSKSVPFKDIGWFHNRMVVTDFKAIIEITSPDSAKTMIISKVDLKAPLPQSLINFLIRNLAGILLYLIQQQSLKVQNNIDCTHAKRIIEDVHFYKNWLLPKFKLLCEVKGWIVPKMAYFDSDTSESDNSIEQQLEAIQISSDTTTSDGDGNETLKVSEGNNNRIAYNDDTDQDSSNTDVNHHQYDYYNLIHTNNTAIDDNSCIDLYTLSRSKKPLIDIHTNISFIVHKPVGTICSTIDSTVNNRKPSTNSRKTIYTIAQESGFPSNLGLVGRLDLETSGIMLFTNDSRLSNAILRPYISSYNTLEMINSTDTTAICSNVSPQFNIEMKAKVYLLGLLQGKEPDIYINEDHSFNILKFENEFGKSFKFSRNCYNIHVNTSQVKFIRRYQHNKYSFGGRDNLGWCIEAYITIYEGKHHQIRRMAIKNRYHTIYLKRIEICNSILNINSIPNPGDCRWLTIDEKIQLYNSFQLI